MFLYVIWHVTWHANERSINSNQGHLILAMHFHLSETGYMATFEWITIHFIKYINPSRSSKEI